MQRLSPAGGTSGGTLREDGEHVVPRRRMQQSGQRAFVRAALMVLVLAPAASAMPIADQLRAELRKERAVSNSLRAELADARKAQRPSVQHAIHLASKAFGVDHAAMLRVARCESTFRPWARNGQYVGLFQAGNGFWRASPFSSFDRTDPYANALATAQVVAAQGWRQWECKP